MIWRRSSDEWASKFMRACVVLCEMQLLADCCWPSNTFTYPTPFEAPKPFEGFGHKLSWVHLVQQHMFKTLCVVVVVGF